VCCTNKPRLFLNPKPYTLNPQHSTAICRDCPAGVGELCNVCCMVRCSDTHTHTHTRAHTSAGIARKVLRRAVYSVLHDLMLSHTHTHAHKHTHTHIRTHTHLQGLPRRCWEAVYCVMHDLMLRYREEVVLSCDVDVHENVFSLVMSMCTCMCC